MAAAAVCLPSFNSTRTDSSDVETFQYEDHGREALKRALTCFEKGQFCDVVLVAGSDGKRIPAHRLILLASKYFHAMFIGSLRESNDKEVTLQEVDSDALHSLVRYLYTGSLELREETVETLLITASFLQIDSAVTACCEFLGRQLHPSNCIGFKFFASQRNLSKLLDESQKFICEHFVEVSENLEFLQLEVDQLVDILSKDELLAPSEEFIFTAALKWIEHDPDNRQKHFAEILAFIRLPLLQTTYIVDNVLPICGTMETKDLVIEAMKWHLLPQRRLSINQHLGVKSTPRKSNQLMPSIIMLAIIQRSNKPSEIQVYDKKIWSTLNTSLPKISCYASVVVGNEIIFVGGVQNSTSCDTFKLNLNNMKRTDMTSMQVPRYCHGLASYNGYLYAVGGSTNSGDALCSLEIWSPSTQVWSSDKNMTTARSASGTAILNGCLYVVGGLNQDSTLNTVECYDVVKMEWNTKTPMHFARQWPGVAVVDGFLYVVGGGSGGAANIERYDPATDAWTLIPAPSVIDGGVSCTALGKKIYVALWKGKVQEYDTVTNKWEEFPAVSGECSRVTLLTTSYVPLPKKVLKKKI